MNPQEQAGAQFEFMGRLAFENAVLRGEVARLQAQVKELTSKSGLTVHE